MRGILIDIHTQTYTNTHTHTHTHTITQSHTHTHTHMCTYKNTVIQTGNRLITSLKTMHLSYHTKNHHLTVIHSSIYTRLT
jgi:hypothetical protein